jgi:hypothetical protein
VLRTDTDVFWQDPVATIRFPAAIPGVPDPIVIGVHLMGAGPGLPAMPPNAWLDLDGDRFPDDTTGGSEPNVPASLLGIEASAGFATSPFGSTPHLQVEIRVPLSIPAGFPDPDGPLAFVPDGPAGLYTPAPGFWTVEYKADAPEYTWTLGVVGQVEIEPDGGVRESVDLIVERAVDVVLLDDLGDGDGLVTFAIPSIPGFDATTLFDMELFNAGDPGTPVLPTNEYSADVNSDGDEDRVMDFASADLLANGVVTPHATDVVLTGRFGMETIAGTVAGLTLPQVGSVPDGGFQVPGAPLTLKKSGSGGLKLFWGASCGVGDTDYAIYEGKLGAPGSHRLATCTTGGDLVELLVAPGPGDHYYLVVPLSAEGAEGSYGVTSFGVQRPQGSPLTGNPFDPVICAPQFPAQDCDL